jgi:tRNA(fMet)-specific endonuclease VapC
MPAWTSYCAKSALLLHIVFDTNVVIAHLRRQQLTARAVLPFAVVGELEAFALKADWGYQKVAFLRQLLERYPLVGFVPELATLYARIDAYSQGKLRGQPA